MAVRDILLVLATYPEPTPVSAIDDAVEVAVALGARISALACEVRIQVPTNALADVLLDVKGMAAAESRKSAVNAEALLAAFQDSAEKKGVFQDRILEHCVTSEQAEVIVQYARLRDLMIMPFPDGDYNQQWHVESVIFQSGRPTLVLPNTRKRSGPFKLNATVLAWDFSRTAARAVADSLPILQKSKKVYVVTVKNEKTIDTRRSGSELAKYLARHGVEVVLDEVDAGGRAIGDVLDSYTASRNADLLVMGAYGHSRVRDFFLGGATKSLLYRPPLPLFLSH